MWLHNSQHSACIHSCYIITSKQEQGFARLCEWAIIDHQEAGTGSRVYLGVYGDRLCGVNRLTLRLFFAADFPFGFGENGENFVPELPNFGVNIVRDISQFTIFILAAIVLHMRQQKSKSLS